ncbi:hypothetical protein CWI35_10415 [[Bacillus] caldolyticus]|uniref:Uncharacterized protein n=1 Tax=Bacillus caldolyticus TaxID=1394 RepID=A0ABM6QN21_BACCL|nr:hypothetical protein CWI35_10415 [[Bacillus] caldolyticus]
MPIAATREPQLFRIVQLRRLALFCQITFHLGAQAPLEVKNIWLRDRQDGDISPLPAGRGLPLGEITAPPLFL